MSKFKKIYEKLNDKFNEGADTEGMFGDKTGFPKGMKPVGDDGFVASQDGGKFDPRDCGNPRNATSPWCGYNPVTPEPIGIDVNLNLNQCGGYVSITPTLGFIEFPPFYAGYLKKECRDDYYKENDKNPLDEIPIDPSKQPIFPQENFPPTPSEDPPKLSPDCWYLISLGAVLITEYGRTESQRGAGFGEVNGLELRGVNGGSHYAHNTRSSFQQFYSDGLNSNQTSDLISLEQAEPTFDASRTWKWGRIRKYSILSGDYRDGRVTLAPGSNYYTNTYGQRKIQRDNYTGWQKWDNQTNKNATTEATDRSLATFFPIAWDAARGNRRGNLEAWWMQTRYSLCPAIYEKGWDLDTDNIGGFANPNVFSGSGASILRYFSESNWTNGIIYPAQDEWGSTEKISYFVLEIFALPCESGLIWNNPPWEEDCVKCCCDGNNNQNNKQNQDVNELLKIVKEINKKLGSFPREIELYDDDANKPKRQTKKVKVKDVSEGILRNQLEQNKILKTAGIEEFQIEFPDTLIEPRNNSVLGKIWNFFRPNKTRKINSIPQLIIWQIEQMSALAGQWHQYIEYEGKDGKGKSTKKEVVLVDPATTMRELFKNQIAIIQTLAVMNDVGLKNLQQTTEGSLMTVEALKRVTDIQDYLDYDTTETKGELPVKISPGEKTDTLEKYLQDSKLAYKWDDWTPDKGQSLQEQLQDIKLILNNLLANGPGES